jgi:hypothetical protein
MPVFALLVLALLTLTAGCGDDTLPRFARPPGIDAGAQDAGRDSGEQSPRDAAESPEDADAGSR